MKPTHFKVIIREDGVCWVAECSDNSVTQQGETVEDSLFLGGEIIPSTGSDFFLCPIHWFVDLCETDNFRI